MNEFSSSEFLAFKARHPQLGEGEIQVLILGIKLKKQEREYICVLDDRSATKIAIRYHISRTGTRGLLDKLNDLGIIDEKRRKTF